VIISHSPCVATLIRIIIQYVVVGSTMSSCLVVKLLACVSVSRQFSFVRVGLAYPFVRSSVPVVHWCVVIIPRLLYSTQGDYSPLL
jgi:hypothetical protein